MSEDRTTIVSAASTTHPSADDDRTVVLARDGLRPVERIAGGIRLNGIYEIDAHLGTGGMSEVWRAHNIQTGEPVAIKLIARSHSGDERMVSLFRREAQTLGRLNHPAIVRYFMFGHDPEHDLHYLAMELVEGPTLRDRLRGRGLTQREACALIARVARGMQVAHDEGVVHRDLSTDNIVLVGGAVDRPKVIDFGIARERDGAEHTLLAEGFAGKYGFVSPEQLGLHGGAISPRTDIYSLGLVFAAALLGRPLDMGGSHAEIVAKRQRLPALDGINPGVRPIVEAMLRPQPLTRIGTMREVAERLESIVARTGAERARKPERSPSGKARRRRRIGAALVPAILLLLLGGGAWWVLSERGAPLIARLGPEWVAAREKVRTALGPLDPSRADEASQPEGTPEVASAEGPASEPAATLRPGEPEPVPLRPDPEPEGPTRPPDPVPDDAPDDPVPAVRETTASTSVPDDAPVAAPPPVVSREETVEPATPASERAPEDEAPRTDKETADVPVAAPATEPLAPSELADPVDAPAVAETPAPPDRIDGEAESDEPAEMALLPRPDPPVEPPERDGTTVSPTQWVERFGPDRCFLARTVGSTGGTVAIEGFGAAVPPFEDMDRRFRAAFDAEPAIGVRLISQGQCPVIDFARATGAVGAGTGATGPGWRVRSDVLSADEPLSAVLENASGATSLFVATPEGTLVNVTALAAAAGDSVMLELPRSTFASADGGAYLLLAVVAGAPFAALDEARADDPSAFLDRLLREADNAGTSLRTDISLLRVL